MRRFLATGLCLALAATAVTIRLHAADPPRSPAPAVPHPAGDPNAPVLQGLTLDDRAALYHLPEGSELFPLAWVKALQSPRTALPFLDLPQRFGLLPDPLNKDGLPVGLTAAPSRGAEFLGPMVGVNCAACHVGELTYRGQSLRIEGGASTFDLNAFYNEIFAAFGLLIGDDDAFVQFADRMVKNGDLKLAATTQQLLSGVVAAELGKLKPKLDNLATKLFQTKLLAIVNTAAAEAAKAGPTPQDPLAAYEARAKFQAALTARLNDFFAEDIAGLIAMIQSGAVGGPMLAALRSPDPIVKQSVQELIITLAIFKARLAFLDNLKYLHATQHPLPGPGRIDAFDGVRDLVFPKSDQIPANAPVSLPFLWLLNQTYWLHWDGNTNSVLERNIGQSLGQGAAFDPLTKSSTVRIADMHALELIVRKIQAPVWPDDLFGKPDPTKVAAGAKVYERYCIQCHKLTVRDATTVRDAMLAAQAWRQAILNGGAPMPPPAPPASNEVLVPVEKVGTDPARALNFAINVGRLPDGSGGIDFALALSVVARAFTTASIADYTAVPPLNPVALDWPAELIQWRTTKCYVARPLVSAWATAPYLHNGSVPTIDALLRPASQRPLCFPVGQHEFDPVTLGHVIDLHAIPLVQMPVLSTRNTTMSGNSNAGHEYGVEMSEDDRAALLEYLKTL
ncbi:MAG: cytochrome c [Planctomycetota bacterium]|nr:cytochrome c [Planctomycetota bacterium]